MRGSSNKSSNGVASAKSESTTKAAQNGPSVRRTVDIRMHALDGLSAHLDSFTRGVLARWSLHRRPPIHPRRSNLELARPPSPVGADESGLGLGPITAEAFRLNFLDNVSIR